MGDTTRLDRILAALPPDDAVYLASLVEPPWKVRARRLGTRDAAVLEAFATVAMQPTPAAHHIARELARYLASAWSIERDRGAPPASDPLRAALQRLARENEGEPIGWRQLLRIRDGARTPVS